MANRPVKSCLESDAYQTARIAGFYDSVRDDGAFYGAYAHLCWTLRDAEGHDEALRSSNRGYWDGRSARRGARASRKLAPTEDIRLG